MIETSVLTQIDLTPLKPWQDFFEEGTREFFKHSKHGDLAKWREILNSLPPMKPSSVDLNADVVRIGKKEDCLDAARNELEVKLRKFHPWRKGPFEMFGIHIDTEWRSDMKWNRLKDHIEPLRDRLVLDVGCGSGYHCLRMVGAGARLALGIDPTLLYVMQFQTLQTYLACPSAAVLPFGIEDLPRDIKVFDSVFSMGLLYHQKKPLDHLRDLFSLLRDGGELILETLVVEGNEDSILIPKDRYAQMRNVWAIPSPLALEKWLQEARFKNIRLIDVTQTTSEEQHVSDWMGFQSLSDFLDPKDPNKTIEGYPAPKRAIFLAHK